VMRALLDPTPASEPGAGGTRQVAGGSVAEGDETERIPLRPLPVAQAADRGRQTTRLAATAEGAEQALDAGAADLEKLRDQLQRAMTAGAGVVRSAASLDAAFAALAGLEALLGEGHPGPARPTAARGEVVNLVTVGRALLGSARARQETRGAHARSDFPRTDPAWRCRLVHASQGGTRAAGAAMVRHGGG
jgi:L-aspartate oxidase